MGRVTYRLWAGSGYDVEEFKCRCTPPVWYGDNALHKVTAWHEINQGTGPSHEVTYDGSTTGEVGGATVIDSGHGRGICADLRDNGGAVKVCHLNETGGYAGSGYCHPGDSGGPVYQRRPNNKVEAAGIIVGGSEDGDKCVYLRIGDTLGRLNAHMLTGGSR